MDIRARASGTGTAAFRRGAALAFLLAALLPPAGSSRAGLDNSHHDMRLYQAEVDPCVVCHGKESSSYRDTLPRETGSTGAMCLFLCHSGKGMLPETPHLVPAPGPAVDLRTYQASAEPDFAAVYFTRSHGNDPSRLREGDGRPVPWPPVGVNWLKGQPGGKMECTDCHAVHENLHAPFLRGPLHASYPERNGFCDLCHRRWATNNLGGPPDGMHPVDFPVDNAAAALRSGSGRHPRRIRIQRYGRADGTGTVPVFDVPNPPSSDLNRRDVHWSMGGHLTDGAGLGMSGWSGTGSRQQMGCYTCHPVHGGGQERGAGLLAVPLVDPDSGWNPVCVGCHGSAASLDGDRREWDVGVTGFGHPAGSGTVRDAQGTYTTTVGNFRFRIAEVTHINPAPGNRFGNRGQLMCTTCHRVHFGLPGTMGIANLGQGTRSICKTCHSGGGIPNENDWSKGGTVVTGHNQPNAHHVTAFRVTLEGDHLPDQESGTTLLIRSPSWSDPVSGLGELASGMDCADCHVFNKTAHNW